MQKITAGMEMLQLLLCVCYKGVQVPTAVVQGETEANSLIPDSLGIGGCLTEQVIVWFGASIVTPEEEAVRKP